jgi:hypothetical protein
MGCKEKPTYEIVSLAGGLCYNMRSYGPLPTQRVIVKGKSVVPTLTYLVAASNFTYSHTIKIDLMGFQPRHQIVV